MAKGIMYVDNIRVEFDDEPTIMDVCRKAGVEMPNFCFHSDLSVYGACRMCMVEDLDTGKIDAACTTKPKNGMRIRTNTSRLLKYRRMILGADACLALPRLHRLRKKPLLPSAGDGRALRHPSRSLQGYARACTDGLFKPCGHIRPQQMHPLRRLRARVQRGSGHEHPALCRPRPRAAH